MKHLYFPAFIITALILLGLPGCISNKKAVYLQGAEDTRITNTHFEERYLIKPQDMLFIRASSLYPESQALLMNLFQGGFGPGGNIGVMQGGGLFYLTGFSVTDSGMVKLPLMGEIKAVGKSTVELEAEIEEALSSYFEDITIQVKLGGIQFTILGDVRAPGDYVELDNKINLFEALGRAGDLNLTANRQQVRILRTDGPTTDIVTVDLTDRSILESPYYYVQNKDIIYVEPLKETQYGITRSGTSTYLTVVSTLSSTLVLIVFMIDLLSRNN